MKILLTGSIAIDRIMVFPGKFSDVIQPEKLHVLSVSVLIDALQDTRGGVAANIAYTLALLQEQPILYGSVGKEAAGYMADLAKMGVDTSQVHYSHLPTAAFTVMTDMVHCQVGGFYPGAMSDAASLTIEKFAKDETFVVISPHDPQQMARQVTECQKLRKRLFYDVGQQAVNIPGEDIRAGIEAAELLIVNDYEISVLAQKTGLSQQEIFDKVPVCVITLGVEGCEMYHKGQRVARVASAAIETVVDPTGAGDAFRAGFLHAYLHDEPLQLCGEYGCTAAAYTVEKQGTQTHTFTMKEFQQRHKQNYLS